MRLLQLQRLQAQWMEGSSVVMCESFAPEMRPAWEVPLRVRIGELVKARERSEATTRQFRVDSGFSRTLWQTNAGAVEAITMLVNVQRCRSTMADWEVRMVYSMGGLAGERRQMKEAYGRRRG